MAARSVAFWLDRIDRRLAIENAAERRDSAAAILAIVEGARQLEASAPGRCVKSAQRSPARFEEPEALAGDRNFRVLLRAKCR
jgi:hypothetical protein